jgi:hypothetical protein
MILEFQRPYPASPPELTEEAQKKEKSTSNIHDM